MDYKITEFDAATEQVVLDQTAELPIEADFPVADYLGEIKKILKCRSVPYITSKQLSTNSAIIDGTVLVAVIYEDSDGTLCTAEYEVPFKKSFESTVTLDDGFCDAEAVTVINSCRAVTERKLSIKGTVKLGTTVYNIQKVPIIADIDEDCIESLGGETEAVVPIGTFEKSTVIDEDIELSENMQSIYRIIRTSSGVNITDCKVLSGKSMISGEMTLSVLYCDGSGETQKLKTKFPFSQIIDITELTEDCKCEVTGRSCSLNITTRTDSEGECRSFSVVSRILLTAKASCPQNVPVIYDAYNTKCKTYFEKKEVFFCRIVKQSNETFLCKKKISFPEGTVRSICDMWCEMSSCSSRQDDKGIVIGGNILCGAICRDNDGGFSYYEKIIDFEYPIAIEGSNSILTCRPEIKIPGCDYNYNSGDIAEVSVELMINATVYSCIGKQVLTSMDVSEDTPAISDEASLIAYFADKGENIWEISKRYLANRKELLELNDLNDEVLQTPKMLLIPRM